MNVVDGNLLILASAGSGKTYQLGNRVIGRVAAGAEPEKIVALTFTRKAAGEFADSVLGKLSEAALRDDVAATLGNDIGLPSTNFEQVLQTIVRSLPKFTLTTIDSFFTRVVRGFQYELGLTGGRFDLLEGPRSAAERERLLAQLLGSQLDESLASDFARAFRRATAGTEGVSVRSGLGNYVVQWHRRFRSGAPLEWGPVFLLTTKPGEWDSQKSALADQAREACGEIVQTDKRQIAAVRSFIDRLESHVVSGRGFPPQSKLAEGILEAVATNRNGDVELEFYKPFTLPADCFEGIAKLLRLAAGAEMSAAVMRTRAIAGVLEGYDQLAETRLRRRGLLGFDDVKRLMGEWQRGEDSRLRREMVDFRLDARYEHWLLDEFQDTSRDEWNGLLPLLLEAGQGNGEHGSLFIVGDRKQAIYGWRGGDVSLFEEVRRTFGDGIGERPMSQSWRSCPEVLDLVNRVCGNQTLIAEMFGIGETRWVWDEHVSAKKLSGPSYAGEACVEVFDISEKQSAEDDSDENDSPSDDPRIVRMIERMRELGVGEKPLTCAVLVRRNQDGRAVADVLRAEGFDVVLDGVREPAKDHPAGVVAWHLLRWLANPGDLHARRVIEMSPLGVNLQAGGDHPWYASWERLLAVAQEAGFAKMLESAFTPVLDGMSSYGRRRISEIVDAMAAFDLAGDANPHAAAEWLERLEVPQNPGAAAIQVMTIHKSKGLGFDVVFLPGLPDTVIPETQRFRVAEGDGWITEVPPSWVRKFFPEIRQCEEAWAADQAYEALCQLYVALTRAKRGLYVYLGKSSKNPKTDTPTLTNWLLRALHDGVSFGTIFHAGDANWAATIEAKEIGKSAEAVIQLASGIPRRKRVSPSAEKHGVSDDVRDSGSRANPAGMEFGTRIHQCFERISWLGEFDPAELPDDDAGACVRSVLRNPSVADVFRKPAGHVRLVREQPVDGIVDGAWLSGIVDRMHVHRNDADGPVQRVEIIDFKSDAVADGAMLANRYAPQMHAYARLIERLYPNAQIELILLSTHLGQIIRVP